MAGTSSTPTRSISECPGPVPSDDVESKRASSSLREPWFLVACCPTNVARTLASLAGYLATADSDGIQIHQYAEQSHRHDPRRRPAGGRRGGDRLSRRRHRRRAGDGDRRAAVGAHSAGSVVGRRCRVGRRRWAAAGRPRHRRRRTTVHGRRRGDTEAAADAALDACPTRGSMPSAVASAVERGTAGVVRRVGRHARASATSTCCASKPRCPRGPRRVSGRRRPVPRSGR